MATEFEQQVVGALLHDSMRLSEMTCGPEHFESATLATVLKTITRMTEAGKQVDAITVADELDKTEGGEWLVYTARLAKEAYLPKDLGAYANEIKSDYIKRRARVVALDLVDSLPGMIAADLDPTITALMNLMTEGAGDTIVTIKEALRKSMDRIGRIMDSGEPESIPTGLDDLDEALGGMYDTDLIVIGARPAMGKTALLQNILFNSGVPCGFISSEQDARQVADRFICIAGGVHGSKIRKAKLEEDDWTAITAGVGLLSGRTIQIDERSDSTIADVRRTARRWKYQHGIKLLGVDYIQRIEGTDKNLKKSERVEEVVRGLKSLAKELNIPVVALAQVSRDVEKRKNRRPGMGDLSDSSAVEKEADQVILLYRDEVYDENTTSPGIAELLIDKNRHGGTGPVRVGYHAPTFRFQNIRTWG